MNKLSISSMYSGKVKATQPSALLPVTACLMQCLY